MICALPPKLLKDLWPQIEPFIAGALTRTDCDLYAPEDIRRLIRDGQMVAFMDYDGTTVRGVAVTQILVFPQKRILNVPFVGGKALKEWMHPMHEALKTYAVESACDRMAGGGRRAWARVLGWREDGIILTLELDNAA